MQYNMDNSSSSNSGSSPPNRGAGGQESKSSHEPIRKTAMQFPISEEFMQQQQQRNSSTKSSSPRSSSSDANTKKNPPTPGSSKDKAGSTAKASSMPKKRALALTDASLAGVEEGDMGRLLAGGDFKRPRADAALRAGGTDVRLSPAGGRMGLGTNNSLAMGVGMGMNTNRSSIHSNLSPLRDVPLPRAPTSPGALGAGALAVPLPHTLRTENFVGANAALRRNLVTLQRRQQQHQNQMQQHQQMQMQDLQLQHFLQEQQQQQNQDQTFGGVGAPSQFASADNTMMAGATSMGLPPSFASMSSSSAAGSAAPRMDDSLMQLQIFRQQQERRRQLEQMGEEAAARRLQLQLLRGGGNMNMNVTGWPGSAATGGFGAGLPGAPPGTSSADAFALLQQQLQQQQAAGGFGLQRQGPFVSSPHHQQGRHAIPSAPILPGGGRPMGCTSESTPSGSSPSTTRSPRPARRPLQSSMARATPMVGPVAPPVPAPPPHLTGQVSYKLPPIEEGETPQYDQRVHVPLAIEEDTNWLSAFQCFVRQELLEVFRASHQDVKIRVASKKVFYQQVGIRCRYCAHCRPSTRAIRSSAFPSSIRQLYQSFTMMLRDHFGNCHAIPPPLKDRFLDLKRNNTQGASDSMRYWIYSAVKLGMVDSDSGIVLNEQTQAAARNKPPFGTTSNTDGSDRSTTEHPARLLVQPQDTENGGAIASKFLYTLLTQYQLIRLLPTECIGNRKSLRPGVPGLGCRYCCQAGRLGLSRVFPAKKKQMPAQIQDLHDHMRRCNLCPPQVKEELAQLKQERDQTRSSQSEDDSNDNEAKGKIINMSDEEDKAFVDVLWQRLGHRGELATPTV